MRESKLCKVRPTGVALVLPSDVEIFLANWIRSVRGEGIPISSEMIRLKARNKISETKFKN